MSVLKSLQTRIIGYTHFLEEVIDAKPSVERDDERPLPPHDGRWGGVGGHRRGYKPARRAERPAHGEVLALVEEGVESLGGATKLDCTSCDVPAMFGAIAVSGRPSRDEILIQYGKLTMASPVTFPLSAFGAPRCGAPTGM